MVTFSDKDITSLHLRLLTYFLSKLYITLGDDIADDIPGSVGDTTHCNSYCTSFLVENMNILLILAMLHEINQKSRLTTNLSENISFIL